MARILFLYDTKETDLAKDFRDLLAELDISLTMIPLAADEGMTLEGKEKKHFNLADGPFSWQPQGQNEEG